MPLPAIIGVAKLVPIYLVKMVIHMNISMGLCKKDATPVR